MNYNADKVFADVSDKTAGYCSYVRKTMNRYLRIFFRIATQMAVVNAWNIYQPNAASKINIVEFMRQIVALMLKLENSKTPKVHHILETSNRKRKSLKKAVLRVINNYPRNSAQTLLEKKSKAG